MGGGRGRPRDTDKVGLLRVSLLLGSLRLLEQVGVGLKGGDCLVRRRDGEGRHGQSVRPSHGGRQLVLLGHRGHGGHWRLSRGHGRRPSLVGVGLHQTMDLEPVGSSAIS